MAYTATELSNRYIVTAPVFNFILKELGYLTGSPTNWHLTDKVNEYTTIVTKIRGDKAFPTPAYNDDFVRILDQEVTPEVIAAAKAAYKAYREARDAAKEAFSEAYYANLNEKLRKQNEQAEYVASEPGPLFEITPDMLKTAGKWGVGIGITAVIGTGTYHIVKKCLKKNLRYRLQRMKIPKEGIELVFRCLETEEDRNDLLQYMDEENPTAGQCVDYALARMNNYEAEEGEIPEYAFKNPPVLKSQLMKDRLADLFDKRGVSEYYRTLISNRLKSDSHVAKFIEAVEGTADLKESKLFSIALDACRDDNR